LRAGVRRQIALGPPTTGASSAAAGFGRRGVSQRHSRIGTAGGRSMTWSVSRSICAGGFVQTMRSISFSPEGGRILAPRLALADGQPDGLREGGPRARQRERGQRREAANRKAERIHRWPTA
jgi:hypothetical protein